MNSIPFKKFIPGIAWFFVILVLICLPKEDIPEPEGWLAWLNKIYFDKWVHTGIFAILAYLFMRPLVHSNFSLKTKWQYCAWIAFAVSIWGMTTEIIQLFVPGRSFDFIDWAADTAGALITLVYYRRFLQGQSSKELR
jgi:hypothetical protein